MLLICIYSIIFLIILKFLLKYRYFFNKDVYRNFSNNHVPWLKSGFSIAFFDAVELFKFLRNIAIKYQRSYKLTVFAITNYSIVKAKDAEKILSSSKYLEKGTVYLIFKSFLNTGLLTSSGEKWHMRRKLLTPAFHFNVLKDYFEIFKEEGDRLVEILKSKSGKEIDIMPISSEFALSTVCEAAMGVKISNLKDKGSEYLDCISNIAHMYVERLSKPWLFSDFFYKILGYKGVFDKYLKMAQGFTRNIINNRKIEFYKKKNFKSENMDVKSDSIYASFKKKRAAMMDTLLQAQSEGLIDDKGIYEETDTFALAGHDTTSSALTHTLLLIALHPEVQQKLFDEIQDITNDYSNLTIDQLNKMNYMERVLKESMRLFPPIPFIARTLPEDLHIDDIVVEKGTTVNIFIYDIHRDPEHYPDPEKFDPDRFLPENCDKRSNYTYLPFSAGMRNCIGQRFAMLELKTMIAKVIQNFKILPVTTREELIFKSDLVMRSDNPIIMKFIPRNQ